DARKEPFAGFDIGVSVRTNQNRLPGPDKGPDRDNYAIKSLIGSKDEAVDLEDHQLAEAERLYRSEKPQPVKSATGRHFRAVRAPENGLLILYLIQQDGTPSADEPPYTGFSVSFPDDQIANGEQVEYWVNSVWQRFEQEEEANVG
ncbi:uncharacterized protein METZ01_LOCUS362496, partial [marine metagenome]